VSKKLALLREFDNNVAVVATTVASITTVLSSFRQNNACRGRWFNVWFGLHAGCSGRGSGASRRLPTSVSPLASSNDHSRALRTPQANVVFSQWEHRKRYGTFALRNARLVSECYILDFIAARMTQVVVWPLKLLDVQSSSQIFTINIIIPTLCCLQAECPFSAPLILYDHGAI